MSIDTTTNADDLAEIGSTETTTGTAVARSGVHSGADEQTGNTQPLRKEKIYLPEKERFEEVPVIAGNSVRGHLRRLLATDLVQRLDYQVTDERLFHLLRAGGVLEQEGKAEIDVGMRREIRDAFPIIDLLGGSTGNQMFGGTVDVHHLIPVCAENDWRLRTDASDLPSYDEFVAEWYQTRMHDNPDDTGMDVDFGFDFDADADEAAGSQQMIYHYDILVPNTRFEHSVRFESYATELARSTMHHGLRLWQEEGVIGGMSAAGMGRINIEYDTDLAAGAQRYVEYVDESGGEIIEALDTLADK